MDWDLIGGNPAPGLPGAVATAASALRSVQSLADSARDTLDSGRAAWGVQDWKGNAAEAFRGNIAALPPLLTTLSTSYGEAARALDQYGDALSAAQQRATAAATAAAEAKDDRARAQSRLDNARAYLGEVQGQQRAETGRGSQLQAQLSGTIDPAQQTVLSQSLAASQSNARRLAGSAASAKADVTRYEAAVAEAEDRLDAARRHASTIRQDVGDAAHRAVSALAAAEHDAHLPGFFDRAKANVIAWTAKWGPVIAFVLQLVSAALLVLSIAFPVLAVAAVIVGALALVVSFLADEAQPGGMTGAMWADLGLQAVSLLAGGLGAGARLAGVGGREALALGESAKAAGQIAKGEKLIAEGGNLVARGEKLGTAAKWIGWGNNAATGAVDVREHGLSVTTLLDVGGMALGPITKKLAGPTVRAAVPALRKSSTVTNALDQMTSGLRPRTGKILGLTLDPQFRQDTFSLLDNRLGKGGTVLPNHLPHAAPTDRVPSREQFNDRTVARAHTVADGLTDAAHNVAGRAAPDDDLDINLR